MIQSSLDTLRVAKPDYTARIGHVWPIVDVPSATSKLLNNKSKNIVDTRQGSVVPGTPADTTTANNAPASSSQLAKQTGPQYQLEENEDKQIWEPFAFAFHGTRVEMERRRMQNLAATAAATAAAASSSSGLPHLQPGGSLNNQGIRTSDTIGTGGGRLTGSDMSGTDDPCPTSKKSYLTPSSSSGK